MIEPKSGIPFTPRVGVAIVNLRARENRAGTIEDGWLTVGFLGLAFGYGARRSGYSGNRVLLVSLVVPSATSGFVGGRTKAGVDGMHMEALRSRDTSFGATEGCSWLSRAAGAGRRDLGQILAWRFGCA